MSLFTRLRGLWRRDQLDADLNEELRSHIAMRANDNVAAGMNTQEACYDAQRRFGNSTLLKEDTRQMDLISWLDTRHRTFAMPFACSARTQASPQWRC